MNRLEISEKELASIIAILCIFLLLLIITGFLSEHCWQYYRRIERISWAEFRDEAEEAFIPDIASLLPR